jgi:hypothetical protein
MSIFAWLLCLERGDLGAGEGRAGFVASVRRRIDFALS